MITDTRLKISGIGTKETKTWMYDKARTYIEAWNEHDLDKLGEMYSPAVMSDRLGRLLQGKDAIKQDRERLLRAFPDLNMDYRHQLGMGSHGIIEWRMRGTHTGILETSEGIIEPTGKCIDLFGISIWEFDKDGLIVKERIYADNRNLFQQLEGLEDPCGRSLIGC